MALVAAVPILAPVAKKIGDGIAGLFGDTKAEKARDARIEALRVRALNGDSAAVVALGYEAFEQRRGIPGDPRSPIDGKRSPQAVRADAQRALKQYVAAFGGLPQAAAQWAAAINAPVIEAAPSAVDVLRDTLQSGVAQGVQQAATERINTTTAVAVERATPWLVIGGSLAAIVVLWRVFK
jgi:hypothetical protein